MLLDVVRILGGILLLYFGAEWLVKGSAGLARAFGVAPLVVGLTVVAYGTSAPELVVTIVAAREGNSGIALGNVIGSNIANLGVILAVTALISPPRVDATMIRREIPILILAAFAVPLVLYDGEIGSLEGSALVLGAIAFTVMTLRTVAAPVQAAGDAQYKTELASEVREETPQQGSRLQLAALAALGLGLLVGGGKIFVDGASAIAIALGMSQRVVGLTIVAIGTSLPELATSVLAALRGHSAIAVGNVVGSNIFNVLLILGTGAAIAPIQSPLESVQVDVTVMIAFSLVAAVVLRGDRFVSRLEGALLASGYGAFLAYLVLAG